MMGKAQVNWLYFFLYLLLMMGFVSPSALAKMGVFDSDAPELVVRAVQEYQELMHADPAFVRLAEHDRYLDAVLRDYDALFAEDSREIIRDVYRQSLRTRLIARYLLIGQKDAFVAVAFAGDKTILEYMELVIALAKTPDARLLYALDPLHNAREELFWQKDGSIWESKAGFPYGAPLTAMPGIRETEAQMAERVDILTHRKDGTPAVGQSDSSSCFCTSSCRTEATWNGLSGGNILSHTEQYDMWDVYRGETRQTYTMHTAADDALWGKSILDSTMNACDGVAYATLMEHRVTMISQGKIHLATPILPDPEGFFRKGKVGLKALQPDLEGFFHKDRRELVVGEASQMMQDAERWAECDLRPAFVIMGAPPFTVDAELVQTNRAAIHGAWQCTAECVIPYRWNSVHMRYERGELECLPKRKWGVKKPS